MKLNITSTIRLLLPAAAMLLVTGCQHEEPGPHEGEGQLSAVVTAVDGYSPSLSVYGPDKKPVFEKTADPSAAIRLDGEWLKAGTYSAVLTAVSGQDTEPETETIGMDNLATARLVVSGRTTGKLLASLMKPVWLATEPGFDIEAGKVRSLQLAPRDIRKTLRLTLEASVSGFTAKGTLDGIATAIQLADGNPCEAAPLVLTFETVEGENACRATVSVLGVVSGASHLLALELHTVEGQTLSFSQDITGPLTEALATGGEVADVHVAVDVLEPIHLYTGIRTRARVDAFEDTPVSLAVGNTSGQYAGSWEGMASDNEIVLTPRRYYPADGSALFLRGYYPAAPLSNGEVQYKLTGQEDLMLSVEQNGSLKQRFDAVATPLTYSHLLSQLNFTLKLEGVSGGYKVRSVHLDGLASTAVVNLSTGAVVPSGKASSVVVYADPGTGGFPIVGGVATLPGYVLVQPDASLTLDLVLAVDGNPAHDLPFNDLPVRFEGGSEGGSAYNVEISVVTPDVPDPDPDPNPNPDPTPDPDPDPKPDPDPDPTPSDEIRIVVNARVIEWNQGEGGSGIL